MFLEAKHPLRVREGFEIFAPIALFQQTIPEITWGVIT
jgi:hypothetical protein